MQETAGKSNCSTLFQDESQEQATARNRHWQTELKHELNYRGWGLGGGCERRWFKKAGNDTRNRAVLSKVMQCRWGGRQNTGNKANNSTKTKIWRHRDPDSVRRPHAYLKSWSFFRFVSLRGENSQGLEQKLKYLWYYLCHCLDVLMKHLSYLLSSLKSRPQRWSSWSLRCPQSARTGRITARGEKPKFEILSQTSCLQLQMLHSGLSVCNSGEEDQSKAENIGFKLWFRPGPKVLSSGDRTTRTVGL